VPSLLLLLRRLALPWAAAPHRECVAAAPAMALRLGRDLLLLVSDASRLLLLTALTLLAPSRRGR
jgi:hypothetical protein